MKTLDYNNDEFHRSRDQGPLIGLENQLRSEFSNWWRTRKWWINIIVWTVLISGMEVLLLTTLPEEQANLDTALQLFTLFAWMGTSVGIIVMMQDSIVGEKLSGTAEWVLSKPVSRSSFVMAKLIANSVSALITMNFIPNMVVYFVLKSWGFEIEFGNFLLGSLLLYLNLFFFLTLTLLCGVVFSSRTPVIGIPIAFLFGQQFASAISFDLFYFIPYSIANAIGPGTPLAIMTIIGVELWSWQPILWSLIFSIAFVVVALWWFEKEEF